MTELHSVTLGSGDRVIFVHGDGSSQGGEMSFPEQRYLADEFELVFVDRHGFGSSSSIQHGDYREDAKDIADLLGKGAHLIGESSGGLVCLLAAHYRPEAVKSLTVIEPPLVTMVRGDPAVENLIKRFQHVYEFVTPKEFWTEWIGAFGYEKPTELELTEKELQGIQATMTLKERFYELKIPLERLMEARFPKLIVSGAWNNESDLVRTTSGNVLRLVCDELQTRLQAHRSVFENASHWPQVETPNPFNNQLREFLKSV